MDQEFVLYGPEYRRKERETYFFLNVIGCVLATRNRSMPLNHRYNRLDDPEGLPSPELIRALKALYSVSWQVSVDFDAAILKAARAHFADMRAAAILAAQSSTALAAAHPLVHGTLLHANSAESVENLTSHR